MDSTNLPTEPYTILSLSFFFLGAFGEFASYFGFYLLLKVLKEASKHRCSDWGHVNTDHPGVLCAPSRWSVSRAASVSMETNYTVCFLIHIWLQTCCSCPTVISPISSVELSFCFAFLPSQPSAFIRCRRGPLSVLSLSSSSVLFYFTSVQAAHLFWLAWVQYRVGRCGRKENLKKKRGWWWRWWCLEFQKGYRF